MNRIGAHVSIAGGVQTAPERAVELEATALGMFTKNQRQWNAKPLEDEDVTAFRTALERSGISQEHVVIHASYLINVGNPDPAKRRKSIDALLDECVRAEQLGLTLVNFHPGSGMGEVSEDETLTLIADACVEVLERTTSAVLVLEVTAGQGAHVGYQFSHVSEIIARAGAHERLGVCIDSCHIFAAGYDVRTPEAYAATMDEFERTVGFERLVGIHLNDSMTELGSRRDRHERIGAGLIGIPGLANFVRDPRLLEVPFVLETTEPEIWKDEIALLRAIGAGATDPETAEGPWKAHEQASARDGAAAKPGDTTSARKKKDE
ncbi:MAG: deoxyribonuclease IV [Spirochaetota bacterium]